MVGACNQIDMLKIEFAVFQSIIRKIFRLTQ